MVNTKEIPPEAILLAVYLELQNGESATSLWVLIPTCKVVTWGPQVFQSGTYDSCL